MLYSIRNYYSLSAIIQGAKNTGGLPRLVKKFDYLINPDYNYKSSQDPTDMTPQLPNPFAAESSYRRNDATLTDRFIWVTAVYLMVHKSSSPRKGEMDYLPQTPRNSPDGSEHLFDSDEDIV
jgi:hypothetical protein